MDRFKEFYKYSIIVFIIFIAVLLTGFFIQYRTLKYYKNLNELSSKKWEKFQNLDFKTKNKLLIKDIDFLVKNLEKKHIYLYHSIKREEFLNEVQKIKNYIRKLTLNKIENGNKRLENQKNNKSSKHNTDLYNFDIDIFIRVQKLVALINDGHTKIYGNINFKTFPFKMHHFDDGYFILGADEKYKKYLGYKVKSINGCPPDEIVKKLFNYVSADNATGKKYYATKLLIYPDYLKFCGYSPPFIFELKNILRNGKSENNIQVTLSDKDLLLKQDLNSLSKKYKFDFFYLIDELKNKPIYLQNLDKYYWYQYDKKNKILYFQYNRCMNMKKILFVDFCNELIDFIKKNDVDKLIIDLRFNVGGDSGLLTKFIDKIVNIEKINKYGHLFTFIGEKTFSSAVLNAIYLKKNTKAMLVGHPSSGSPNHFGEVKQFLLPSTGLIVSYSTKYFFTIDVKSDTLYPDKYIEYNFNDFINGIDPAYKFVKKY